MPNWCAGKLKVRGNIKDILNFLNNGIELLSYDSDFETIKNFQKYFYNAEMEYIEVKRNLDSIKSSYWIYVKGTERNFIELTDTSFEGKEIIEVYDTINSKEKTDNNEKIIVLQYKAAWDIKAEKLAQISNNYQVDFKIYAFERGREFNRDIEINRGKIIKNEEIQFGDYQWECINPNLGG